MRDDDELIGNERTATLGMKDLPAEPTAVNPCLVAVYGSALGRMVRVEKDVVIGRADHVTFVMRDQGVSREHAKVTRDGTAVVFQDLGSTNGSFVNGVRVDKVSLSEGDKIQIGQGVLKFTHLDEVVQASVERDELTGALNKKQFADAVRTDFATSAKRGVPMTLALLDVDHLRRINELHGHAAGDAVLRAVASVSTSSLLPTDSFARYGGEEFGISMPDTTPEAGLARCQELHARLGAATVRVGGKELRFTVSIGVATADGVKIETPKALVKAADDELYAAKRDGRNRVCSSASAAPKHRVHEAATFTALVAGRAALLQLVAIGFAEERRVVAERGQSILGAWRDELSTVLVRCLREGEACGHLGERALVIAVDPKRAVEIEQSLMLAWWGPKQTEEQESETRPAMSLAALKRAADPLTQLRFVGASLKGAEVNAAALDRLAAQLIEEPRHSTLRNDLPLPLAKMYVETVNRLEKYAIADGCLKLFEAALRYLVLTSLARLRAELPPRATTLLASGLLKKPALGSWVGLVRHLEEIVAAERRTVLGVPLLQKRNDLPALAALLERLQGKPPSRFRLIDVLDALTALRNQAAHQLSQVPLAELAGVLTAGIEELLTCLPALREPTLLYARTVTVQRRKKTAELIIARGANARKEELVVEEAAPIHGGDVYLRDSNGLVRVSPFIVAAGDDFAFFSGVIDGRVEYECPYTEVTVDDLDQHTEDLREAAPYLFEAAPHLEKLVPAIANATSSGVLSPDALAKLTKNAKDLGLKQEDVDNALALYAPLVEVQRTQ